jgi:hypothetical protein
MTESRKVIGSDLPLLNVGRTLRRNGEMCIVAAVLLTGGERYYHLLHLDGSVEMVPAITLAGEKRDD